MTAPSHSLYYASGPGKTTPGPEGESWESTCEAAAPLRLELAPRSVFLRNRIFAWASDYLYRPNLGTVVVAVGLAALTLVLIRRPRPAGPENR